MVGLRRVIFASKDQNGATPQATPNLDGLSKSNMYKKPDTSIPQETYIDMGYWY